MSRTYRKNKFCTFARSLISRIFRQHDNPRRFAVPRTLAQDYVMHCGDVFTRLQKNIRAKVCLTLKALLASLNKEFEVRTLENFSRSDRSTFFYSQVCSTLSSLSFARLSECFRALYTFQFQ